MGGGDGWMKRYKTWRKRLSNRLKSFDYTAPGVAYHVILSISRQSQPFTNTGTNSSVVDVIKRACGLHDYTLIAYCLMPDHLHLLVQCGESRRDLKDFVGAFKSYANKVTGRRLWQRGFYEHVVRKDEHVLAVAEYILNNPVRKGLVAERKEYRWGELCVG
jgi:putative transposase